ncbi:hypothetical protein FRC00_006315 [Tulasnella sp. 408]|nr:hypothetical protein FRC00_006315 [Tulasnella sp. 408]
MNIPQREPKLKSIPDIPLKFGEDGGHFYKYYDSLTDELDEDMVKSLKAQLDSILIFAGLFAGVNTAFLALTLPKLNPDPADDTNALLLQLVIGGNGTIRSADDLPSATFNPPLGIPETNMLFSLSLALAIACAFFAILGQQWIVCYRQRSGSGAEHQRWEQLRRHFGVRHWRLETILDDILPGLLQIALVIFSIAFLYFIQSSSRTMYYLTGAFMEVTMTIAFLMALVSSWDRWCPFKSPLSRFLQLLSHFMIQHRKAQASMLSLAMAGAIYMMAYGDTLLGVFGATLIILFAALLYGRIIWGDRLNHWVRAAHYNSLNLPTWLENPWKSRCAMIKRVVASSVPAREEIAYLQAAATQRVLCTSEDVNALIYTAVNIEAMEEKQSALFLLEDDVTFRRLMELTRNPDMIVASAFS